jgi:hypothetical protein
MANTFKFGNGNWAVKEDYALAYNDENNNFKPLPFDFTRASSATRVNKQGLIETVPSGKPRIDFLNNTKGHLLLEPSRTNLFTYSEDFTQSNWAKVNSTLLSNQATSPTGENNASLLTATAATGGIFEFNEWTTTQRTATFFVKKNTAQFVEILNASASGNRVKYDLDNGTIDTESGSMTGMIVNYGNGWYRLSATHTHTGTGTFGLRFPTSGESVYIWGAQIEAGSYATSYIPTSGSTVTRSAETCNDAGNSTVFNDSEGVLFTELAALANDGTTREMALSDGGASNRIELRYISSANVIQTVIRGAASTIVLSYTLTDATEFAKVAVKYKSGDYALWVNGVERATSTTTGTPTGLSQFAFDDGNGNFNIYAKIKQAKLYNTTLTDSELQQLTS